MQGKIYCAINKNVIDSSCPRCSETEDWDHVVKFRYVEGKIDEHLNKLNTHFFRTHPHRKKSQMIIAKASVQAQTRKVFSVKKVKK